MPRRRKGAKFEQISEFERGRIVGLREAGLSYRAVAAHVQRNRSTILRVSKQWTDEGRTARKSGSGPRNVTSARDDRRLVRMVQTDRTASSIQLAAQWSTAACVSLCASSIRRRLLQRAGVLISSRSSFLTNPTFICHHDGRIRVRRYAGERHIPECIIEHHSGRTTGVMVWGAIAYHGRLQLLRIVGNLNSTRYINEFLLLQDIPFLQGLPGAVFQQDNARPHVAKTVKYYLDSQQVQLLPSPAYSPDMSPIEHEWDIVGRRIARDLRTVASTDELWLRIQTIWNTLPQTDIKNLFNSNAASCSSSYCGAWWPHKILISISFNCLFGLKM
ncbi:transposable element Tcb2 transposase [Trichonephila clavipes]|uniref:Transposable element Tcb2 transposase n=1 Tax=Trichonephila clavipes TaxID=2585209 RepID=A0A8X6T992_TRICX|nr:transposable element Tcb2 transposase [Trichonephila clavipes]